MPGILDLSMKATPCAQKLLDLRLGPWMGSKKRQLRVQSMSESSPKRREAGSCQPGGNSSTIEVLLNAAEHIAASTQTHQLPSVGISSSPTSSTPPESLAPETSQLITGEAVPQGSGWHAVSGQLEVLSKSRGSELSGEVLGLSRRPGCVDLFPQSNGSGEEIVTGDTWPSVNLQAESRSILNSPVPQPSSGPVSDQGATTGETSAKVSLPATQIYHQVDAGETNIAIIAEVGKSDTILGEYLFKGISKSRVRHREESGGMKSFTNAVRLHFTYNEGEDFVLEVWLCPSIGEAILQAKMRSLEDLRPLISDYLFEAMKSSNWKREMEGNGILECGGAVTVSFPNGHDAMLRGMWTVLFSSPKRGVKRGGKDFRGRRRDLYVNKHK